MRSFEIYSKWSVQASKHRYTRAQCSHASVGLAQARPNDGEYLNSWRDIVVEHSGRNKNAKNGTFATAHFCV